MLCESAESQRGGGQARPTGKRAEHAVKKKWQWRNRETKEYVRNTKQRESNRRPTRLVRNSMMLWSLSFGLPGIYPLALGISSPVSPTPGFSINSSVTTCHRSLQASSSTLGRSQKAGKGCDIPLFFRRLFFSFFFFLPFSFCLGGKSRLFLQSLECCPGLSRSDGRVSCAARRSVTASGGMGGGQATYGRGHVSSPCALYDGFIHERE
ncbi:hypothetical protein LZ32DRAFT_126648 [Colletotrichum eremochloae]|nr:hypothetical protein LZ32DRAFT_126648 [Colletotrichum eremochloae]